MHSNILGIKYPFKDHKSRITLQGRITNENSGLLAIKGWINFGTADLQLRVSSTNTRIEPFEPYYKKTLGENINDGYANVSTLIKVNNHVLDINGNLKLYQLTINKHGRHKNTMLQKVIFKIIKQKRNQVKADFHVKGDLNDPDFHPGSSIIKSIITNITKETGISIGKKSRGYFKEKSKKGLNALKNLFKKDRK